MPGAPPSKPQLAIYAALAIAVLLIGARFLRSGGGAPSSSAPLAFTTTTPTTTAAGVPDGLSAAADGGAGSVAAGRLVVDVKGAVHRPGVYRLASGARAYDAVRRAGGLTRRADRVGVNLAARVVDGGEVVVPERTGAGTVAAGGSAGGAAGAGGTGQPDAPLSLDVNSATEQELEQLDGVGPATAAKIVAYREQHGPFASLGDLQEVSGIGEAKLAAIRAQLGQ